MTLTTRSARPAHRLPSLSAVFPAYDEEANVGPMAAALAAVLPEVADRWEVVIVNDGSRDRTGALADGLARTDDRVRVVHHAANEGYGAAVRTGLATARYDAIFVTDGDRQFDPAELRALVPVLARADVVVGYRHRRADHLGRRLAGRWWSRLVRGLFRLPVRDVNCAFKLLRRPVVNALELRSNGAVISAELLVRAAQRGYSIAEVPVAHRPRLEGRASGARPRVIVRALRELVRLKWEIAREVAGEATQGRERATVSVNTVE